MNAHGFYNILEGRCGVGLLHNGVNEYPEEFLSRYNDGVAKLSNLVDTVTRQIAVMDALEKEQFQFTSAGKIQKVVEEYKERIFK